jgi:hypothetical protein
MILQYSVFSGISLIPTCHECVHFLDYLTTLSQVTSINNVELGDDCVTGIRKNVPRNGVSYSNLLSPGIRLGKVNKITRHLNLDNGSLTGIRTRYIPNGTQTPHHTGNSLSYLIFISISIISCTGQCSFEFGLCNHCNLALFLSKFRVFSYNIFVIGLRALGLSDLLTFGHYAQHRP